MRRRGRPRKNPLPFKDDVVEQDRVEEQQDPVEEQEDTLVPAMVADDVEEEAKQEPFTPVPVAVPVSQTMFGSMRKMLFREGV